MVILVLIKPLMTIITVFKRELIILLIITNNLSLVQHNDYNKEKSNVIIIGDSM